MADDQISFTEKEFDFAVESEIPVLVFPIGDPDSVAVSRTDKDTDKAARLGAFRQKAMDGRLVQTWQTSDELALGVVKALKNAETAYPRAGWIRGDTPPNETLLAEIRELRLENEELKKTQKSSSDSDLKLNNPIVIEYSIGKSKQTRKARLPLSKIVYELQLTETPDTDVISKCVRGALAASLGRKL